MTLILEKMFEIDMQKLEIIEKRFKIKQIFFETIK